MPIVKTYTDRLRFYSYAMDSSRSTPLVQYGTNAFGRSRSGSANPLWRQQVRNHVNASTIFSANEQTLDYSPGSLRVEGLHVDAGILRDVYSAFFGASLHLSSTPLASGELGWVSQQMMDEANRQAVTSLYKKVRSIHSQVAGGVILGEIFKTVKMMARPAEALQKSVIGYVSRWKKIVDRVNRGRKSDYSVRNKRDLRDLKQAITGSYLEATYGWQPLVNDVKDAAIAAARIVKGDLVSERFRSIGSAERYISGDQYRQFEGNNCFFDFITRKTAKVQVVYYGAFLDSALDLARSGSLQQIINLSGFHLREFVPTMWELVPWSFFVDYFTNIGDMLMAATTDTSKVAWLTKVIIKDIKDEAYFVPSCDYTVNWWRGSGWFGVHAAGRTGVLNRGYRQIDRAPTVMPYLVPRFHYPELGGKHMLNTVALMAGGAFSSRVR